MNLLQILQNNFSGKEILKAKFGLEREALRVNESGELALTKHPDIFGCKLDNPYITTDFSESQVEMITPTFDTVEESHQFLDALYDIVAMEIGDELLWPQSMPCKIKKDMEIPVADFGTCNDGGSAATEYRKYLLKKYGGKKQLISGIHYNFSFEERLIEKLYKLSETKLAYRDFKDNIYLKVARNYLRYRWFLVYLLGGTSLMHDSFVEKECAENLQKVSEDTLSSEGALSFRNSECGYDNQSPLYSDYTSVTAYVESIKRFIEEGKINTHKELYSAIRLKSKNPQDLFSSLTEDGIKYIEIRSIDINPYEKAGISVDDLKLVHLFMIFCLVEEEQEFKTWQQEALINQRKIARKGLIEIELHKNGSKVSKEEWIKEIVSRLEQINNSLELGMEKIIKELNSRINDNCLISGSKLVQNLKEKSYTDLHLHLAKGYKGEAFNNRFKLNGYEDLELSTQILLREAIKRGIKFEIIDRVENFISLSEGSHIEYIKQATKTGVDSYITFLMMENKVVTKEILSRHNVNVPKGVEFSELEDAILYTEELSKKPIVVKPKSTNFGIGISIFSEGTTKQDLDEAIKIAFEHDNTVIVEEFIPGKEYRFLVIGDEVAGILHRVPANVVGDGEHSIAWLIAEKSKDPLRGKGYKTPLEKIPMDSQSELFLKQRGMSFETIIPKGEKVYLRENSNISTGGDSIDYTDEIPQKFKQIAIEASAAVGAKICGVDMMIEDFEDENSACGIIELNFNPAIHIHSFPYIGKERKIASKLIKLLGFSK